MDSILGTSGQPLEDMCKYLPEPEFSHPETDIVGGTQSLRLQLAIATLEARHLAPTAPDTLYCYPYFSSDPFVLAATPHMYFSGKRHRSEDVYIPE